MRPVSIEVAASSAEGAKARIKRYCASAGELKALTDTAEIDSLKDGETSGIGSQCVAAEMPSRSVHGPLKSESTRNDIKSGKNFKNCFMISVYIKANCNKRISRIKVLNICNY